MFIEPLIARAADAGLIKRAILVLDCLTIAASDGHHRDIHFEIILHFNGPPYKRQNSRKDIVRFLI